MITIYYCDSLLQQPVRMITAPFVVENVRYIGLIDGGDGQLVLSPDISPSECAFFHPTWGNFYSVCEEE